MLCHRNLSVATNRGGVMTKRYGLLLTLLVASTALTPAAHAANVNWSGTGTNWNNSGNWGGQIPTSADNAVIDNSMTALIGGYLTPAPYAATLVVGATNNSTNADLQINNGYTLTVTSSVVIGRDAGSHGTIEVSHTGTGSTLSASTLTVGSSGTGALAIANASTVSVGGISIGFNAGSNGTVTVTGTGSTLSGTTFSSNVGAYGTGSLTVSSGGAVNATNSAVGYGTGSTGTATVTGTGSTWTNSGVLSIGNSGTGALTIASGGAVSATTVMLGANNGSSGTLNIGAASGSTAVAPGTLTASGGVAFGSGTGVINFNHTSSSYVFASVISGSSGTINVLAGTTTLTGNSSAFTGTTSVTAGTLSVNGTLGGNVSVASGGTLGGSGTIGGNVAIASGGILAPGNSPGMLTINGNLTLNSGSVLNYDLGAAGTVGGALNDLTVVNGNLTLAGTLNVTQSVGGTYGAGVYRLFNYTGTLTNNGLTLGSMPSGSTNVLQTSTAGQVNLVASFGPAIQFWGGGSGTWSNSNANTSWTNTGGNASNASQNGATSVFQGTSGTVTVDDSAGQVQTGGMQFATNGYTVQGGALQLVSGTDAIRVGDGTNAGTNMTATIASSLIGAGGLNKTDLGTLVLTGANTYSGGTTITGGTLVGGVNSFGSGAITNNANLVINQASNGTFGNVISGNGSLTKIGAGVVQMTANSSGFTGPTNLVQGGLQVTGSLGGTITVQSGATLSGTGTVGGVIVNSGGTVAPGPGVSTLSVTGNYAQASGSIYQAILTPGSNGSSLIQIGGTANLANGAVINVSKSQLGAYTPGAHYTVLTAAGGVTGTPTLTGDTRLSAFYSLTAHTDAHNVYIDAAQSRAFADAGNTPNQKAAATGLQSLARGNALGMAIGNLQTDTQAQAAFDSLSGELQATVKGALADDSRLVRGAITDHLRNTTEQNLWGQAYGDWGHRDGNTNAASLSSHNIGGVMLGWDKAMFDTWRVGLAGGYGHGVYNVDARTSRATSDNYTIATYGGTQWDALSLRLGAAVTWSVVDTQRAVSFSGYTDSLSSSHDSRTTQGFVQAGYRINLDTRLTEEPFAEVSLADVYTPRFSEAGGQAALRSASDHTDVTSTLLGSRFLSDVTFGDTNVNLSASAAWRHNAGDLTPGAMLNFAGSNSFAVTGAALAQNAAQIEAGLSTVFTPGLLFSVSYQGQFAAHEQAQGIRASMTTKF